tara:strand:- start:4478 stop:6937 length:2460 start_codon:yes stop_codon:yes gene_type:complete
MTSNLQAILNPVNATKKLSERYDRRSKQLEKWTTQLKEQSHQQYVADTTNTPKDMIMGLSELVNTVGSLKKKPGTEDEKKKKEVYQNLETLKATKFNAVEGQGSFSDHLKAYYDYKKQVQELKKDGQDFSKLTNHLVTASPETYEYINSLHGSQIEHVKAFASGKISAEFPQRWSNQLNYKGKDALLKAQAAQMQEDWKALDEKGKRAYQRRWASKQLGDEILHEGLLQTHVIDNLNTWLDSEDIIASSAIRTVVLDRETDQTAKSWMIDLSNNQADVIGQKILNDRELLASKITEDSIQWSSSGGTVGSGEYIQGITPEMKPRQIANAIIYQRLSKLADAGYLSSNELQHLNTYGAIDTPFGKQIKTLFTDEQWGDLRTRAIKGDTFRTNVAMRGREAKWTQTATALQAQMMEPENYNEDTLRTTIDTMVAQGAPEKIWKPLEQMLENNQSQSEMEALEGTWELRRSEGFTSENKTEAQMLADIEAIPHVTLRNKYKKEFEEIRRERDATGFTKELKGNNHDRISEPGKIKLKGAELIGEATVINTKFHKLGNKLFNAGFSAGKRGKELTVFVETELEREWITKGGGKRGGDGIYSTDVFGNYKNHKVHNIRLLDIKATAKETATKENIEMWTNDFETGKQSLGENFSEWTDLTKNPEAIMSAEDFAGMAATGIYSDELKWKAGKLGLLPGQLFERQLQALIGSEDPKHQDLVAKYNLGEVDVSAVEVDFFKKLGTNHREIPVLQKLGLKPITPSQAKRLEIALQISERASKSLDKGEAMTGVKSFKEEDADRRIKELEELAKQRRIDQRSRNMGVNI